MAKIRANKDEQYWYICFDDEDGEIGISMSFDDYTDLHDVRNRVGNYFRTKQDAEAVVEKIRKVLKEADALEMPSEEDAYNEEFKTNRYLFCEDGAAVVGAHQEGFIHCFEWIKSKIIK